MTIAETLLPEFDQEMANTRKCLERLPEDKFQFSPHRKSWPMITLASHIAQMTQWATMTLDVDEFDYAPAGGSEWKSPEITSTAQLVELFDKGLAEARAKLASASDEHMMKPWSLLATGKVVFSMPRVAVLRSMVLNHIIHHRAQLTVYMRLTDVPVPGLYGPSADEA